MPLPSIITDDGREKQGAYIIANRYDARILAGDLITLLDGRYRAIKVGEGGGEDAAHDPVQDHVRLLVSESTV